MPGQALRGQGARPGSPQVKNLLNRIRRLAHVLGWGSWCRSSSEQRWLRDRVAVGDGQAISYAGELLELRGLTIATRALAAGESEESWTLGFHQPELIERLPLQESLRHLRFFRIDEEMPQPDPCPVIAVRRMEWANLYHSMVELYDAYLAARFLGLEPSRTNVLFVDSHPPSPFGLWWSTLFAQVRSVSEISPTRFDRVVFCSTNDKSDFNSVLGSRPSYVNDLSRALRRAFDLSSEGHLITLISRQRCRERVLANERELLSALRARLPEAAIVGVILEDLSLLEQMRLIGRTRILLGTHGAGLSYALLLPEGSGVLELFLSLPGMARFHFRNICRWRRLPYRLWGNWRSWREPVGGRAPCDIKAVVDRVERLWHELNRV